MLTAFGDRQREAQRAENYRTAMLVATMYNLVRQKGQKPFTASDFLKGEKPQQTPEQFFAKMGAIATVTRRLPS